jgi:hypothetical protein
MNFLRGTLALLGVVLAILIAWAVRIGDFGEAGRWLTSDPWGIVTLADLYFGFLLSAVIIGFLERSWKAVLWIAPIPVLGNVWTVLWVIFRFPVLIGRKQSTNS